MDTLGERIKYARQSNNYTQTSFAELIGKEQTSVSKYEKNQMSPTADVLSGIISTLSVSAKWLLTGEGNIYDNNPIPNNVANNLTPTETFIIDTYNSLSENKQVEFLSMLRDFWADNQSPKSKSFNSEKAESEDEMCITEIA